MFSSIFSCLSGGVISHWALYLLWEEWGLEKTSTCIRTAISLVERQHGNGQCQYVITHIVSLLICSSSCYILSSTFPPGASNRRYQFAELPAYLVILKLLTLKGTRNNAKVTFSSFPFQLHFIVWSLQLILPIHFNLLSGSSVKAAEEFDKFFSP